MFVLTPFQPPESTQKERTMRPDLGGLEAERRQGGLESTRALRPEMIEQGGGRGIEQTPRLPWCTQPTNYEK